MMFVRFLLLALFLSVGCGWPTVAPAPRDGLTDVQAEAYRALAHALSGYMNARAHDIELDLELAGILEEVLLHARSVEDEDWRRARTMLESELGAAKVPQDTVVPVWLLPSSSWHSRWDQGERLTGVCSLDDLISTYDIRVVRTSTLGSGHFDLSVPREVNGFALQNRIAEVPGVGSPISGWDSYARGNSYRVGEGVSIRPATRHGGWSLRVGLGWGDCPAGCISGRRYLFEVDADGETRLVNVTGDPLP